MNFESKVLWKSSSTQFLLLFQVWDSFTSLDLSWRGQSAVIWMRFLMLRSPVPGGTSPSLAVTQTILQQEEILLSSVVMVLPLSRYFNNYCCWWNWLWWWMKWITTTTTDNFVITCWRIKIDFHRVNIEKKTSHHNVWNLIIKATYPCFPLLHMERRGFCPLPPTVIDDYGKRSYIWRFLFNCWR